VIKRPKVFAL